MEFFLKYSIVHWKLCSAVPKLPYNLAIVGKQSEMCLRSSDPAEQGSHSN